MNDGIVWWNIQSLIVLSISTLLPPLFISSFTLQNPLPCPVHSLEFSTSRLSLPIVNWNVILKMRTMSSDISTLLIFNLQMSPIIHFQTHSKWSKVVWYTPLLAHLPFMIKRISWYIPELDKWLSEMQTISCYPLSTYTSIELDKIPLASSIDDLLSPMHLFLHATVRCQTMLEHPQSKLFQQEYPTWKRFIGEIEQYAERETRVMTSPYKII